MKKDYTLTFTMADGTTRTVNFSLPVAAANASEISCTGFSIYEETERKAFVIEAQATELESASGYTHTFTVSEPKYIVNNSTVDIKIRKGNTEEYITDLFRTGYSITADNHSLTIDLYKKSGSSVIDPRYLYYIEVNATIGSPRTLTNVEDCLN